MFASLPRPVRDLALLGTRLVLGVILMAHGWQKFGTWGISGTTASFEKMGVPLAGIAAPFTGVVELVGGLLLVLGLFTPLVSLLVIACMLGAWFFAPRGNGVFVSDGGGELVYGRRQADRDLHCSGATTAEARELADARR